jgi:tetratricopeptide (TPR) repeat protein
VQIRVGLNSGEVVVRTIGSDLHMDYTAVGQATHLASRMEQLASPGTILLTAFTLALVEGFVVVKALGPVPVKGLVDPIEVYEVTGTGPARTRLQATARRGLTPFVGRDAEMVVLQRAQELAEAGRGQVVAAVGEAGVGKSRLVHEFTHSHRLQSWLILETAAVSYGKATSYLPVTELLKRYFKIADRDDLRAVREKVTGQLVALDRALEPTLPAILSLFDAPVDDVSWLAMDAAQRRQCTLDAVKQLLLREARERPLLVIFEDLHWIDRETQALLDSLVESLGSARLLLLVNYRPAYQHAWGTRTYYNQFRLDALSSESAAELLDALLGGHPALAPLKQMLVKRGNPFFLEETVRSLVETKVLVGGRLTQPIQTIQVPATVQTVLAARIDRLTPEDKRLLQTAAVVGKDVPFVLLQAVAELPDAMLRGSLERLRAGEFLYETGTFSGIEYTFKHALTHEVTYGGLLQNRRRELHARIVSAIETLYRERLEEQIERLAHHAVRGDLGGRAVHYLQEAGRKAAWRSLDEARGWFDQALGLLATLPENLATLEQAVDLRLDLRRVLGPLGEPRLLMERLREAEALAEKLNDERRRGRVYAAMLMSFLGLGHFDEALKAGDRALKIAEHLGDLRLRISTTSSLGVVHFNRGDFVRAGASALDNIAKLPAGWAHEHLGNMAPPSVVDRWILSSSLAVRGRFTEAIEHAAESIRLAESTRHPYTEGAAHWAAAAVHMNRGDWEQVQFELERCLAIFRTGNVAMMLPRAVAASALASAQLGESSRALQLAGEGEKLLAGLAASGVVDYLGATYRFLGVANLRLGRLDDARRLCEHSLELCVHRPGEEASTQRALGDIAAYADRFDAASSEAHYRKALALAAPRGMRPLIAHCHAGLGKLFWHSGLGEQAREHRTIATTMYREMGMTYWLDTEKKEVP